MTARVHGRVVWGVIAEARQKFGPTTEGNKAEVTRWVRARINELAGRAPADVKPFEPRPADAKERAAGRDD